jgi:hypothetical protein
LLVNIFELIRQNGLLVHNATKVFHETLLDDFKQDAYSLLLYNFDQRIDERVSHLVETRFVSPLGDQQFYYGLLQTLKTVVV